MNTYSGVPDNFRAFVESMQTKALEQQINAAIKRLTEGQNGQYEAVTRILGAFVGEEDTSA